MRKNAIRTAFDCVQLLVITISREYAIHLQSQLQLEGVDGSGPKGSHNARDKRTQKRSARCFLEAIHPRLVR